MYAISICNLYSRRFGAALAAVVALCAFCYGALLLGAVSHAAHRTEAQSRLAYLAGEVSKLENQYLTETKSLSPQKAAVLGFVPPTNVATVFASVQTLTLGR